MPRAVELLAILVERSGEALDKDELIKQVWGDTIVEENNLARQISSLRKALGESPSRREYIATIPGVGYRFVAPVVTLEHPFTVRTTAPTPRRPITWAALAGIAVTAAMVTVMVVRDRAIDRKTAVVPRSIGQFTYGGGLQQDPAWSSDGKRIAFASDRLGHLDLWVQGVQDSDAVRVTSSPAGDSQPDWSPDGQRIAFRSERDGGGLYVVSASGGAVQRISEFGDHPHWSPIGNLILFSNATVRTGARKLYVVEPWGGVPREVGTSVIEPLTTTWYTSVDAAWHPDGARISVWGQRPGGAWAFVTLPLSGGASVSSTIPDAALREMNDAHLRLGTFVWAQSGKVLYFEGQSGASQNIWRIRIDPSTLAWIGVPERLTTDVGEEADIALSPDGARLAFTVRSQRTRVWAFDFDPRTGRVSGPASALTSGSAGEVDIDTLADGSRVAYRAVRAGRHEFREVRTANREERLLLVSNDWTPSTPRWSADGRRLAYARASLAAPGLGRNIVAVLSPDEGQERVLTLPDQVTLRPTDWSVDGAMILGDCRTAPGESMGICSVAAPQAATGTSHPHVLVHDPNKNVYVPRLSPDQRWVTFLAVDVKGSDLPGVFRTS